MNSEQNISLPKITLAFVLTLLVACYPLAVLHPDLLPTYLSTQEFQLAALIIAAVISFLFFRWLILNRKSLEETQKIKALFENLMTYFLALEFTKWACLKFFHLHMTTSLAWMEMPQTMLSGYQKVAHFYGQNYPLVVALGIIELLGALFILFSKTRLLGAFILVSACLNILLIDITFQVTRPILEASILLTASSYFIFKEKEKLLNLFFGPRAIQKHQLFTHKRLKGAIKISALLIPILIFLPNYKTQLKPSITGKYKILEFHNPNQNKTIEKISREYDNIYFDLGDYFAFTSNDFEKRLVGKLDINEKSRKFKVTWLNEKDQNMTFSGTLNSIDSEDNTKIIGFINEDPIEIYLHKEKVKSIWDTY